MAAQLFGELGNDFRTLRKDLQSEIPEEADKKKKACHVAVNYKKRKLQIVISANIRLNSITRAVSEK